MKKMRRFAAIAAAAAMTACMAVPMMSMMTASAADTATITINGAATGSTYVGYQLMSLTQDGDAYSYTVNSDFSDILKAAAGNVATDADVIKYLEDNKDNATVIRDFADAVYTAILAGDYESVELSATAATTVDQGYYLVAEKTTGTHVDGTVDDTFSLVMLNTAGDDNVTVTTKEGTPSLIKKIKDANDSTDTAETVNNWQDSADYDIGDDIPFQLTGTVSSKYGDYNEYYYAFHDNMCDGLTFNEDSVKVYVDNTLVTGGYEVVVDGECDDADCTFEVQFADLKKITGATVTKDSKIVVEYTAKLNTSAVLGSAGNPNVADLEYSTNPYFTGGGTDGKDSGEDTGYTPEDKVIAFTYKLDVNKVKKDGTALTGAEFSLEKNVGGVWNKLELVKNDAGTVFTFTGLDDGEYRITETQEPQGYNKLTESIYFTVSATHDVESDDPALTVLTNSYTDTADLVTGDVTTGAFTVDVVNESGNILPSTGGIGTTLFYVIGGTLAAGAGVSLIAKKRMKNEE